MNKQVTIKELAEALGEDYQTVAALIKFLVNQGVVKAVGHRANPAGTKGKPSTVYEVPNEIELVFWEDQPESQPEEVKQENPVAETVTEVV